MNSINKWTLIIVGIVLIAVIGIGVKIYSDLNEITESFKSEHSLNEPNLNILTESTSPNRKYIYYEYQFDNGGFGYSRVFWSVIENKKNRNDLKKGLIPNGYKIVEWNNNNELVLKMWKPYYETKTTYELNNKKEFNGVRISIQNNKKTSK